MEGTLLLIETRGNEDENEALDIVSHQLRDL